MNCKNHPDRPAVGACVTCGHMVCEECKVEIDDKIHCKSCVSERFSKKRIIPRLYRSISDRKLAGVCGGLADYFQIDSNIVRAVFVIVSLPFHPAFLVGPGCYVLFAILLPEEDQIRREERRGET